MLRKSTWTEQTALFEFKPTPVSPTSITIEWPIGLADEGLKDVVVLDNQTAQMLVAQDYAAPLSEYQADCWNAMVAEAAADADTSEGSNSEDVTEGSEGDDPNAPATDTDTQASSDTSRVVPYQTQVLPDIEEQKRLQEIANKELADKVAADKVEADKVTAARAEKKEGAKIERAKAKEVAAAEKKEASEAKAIADKAAEDAAIKAAQDAK